MKIYFALFVLLEALMAFLSHDKVRAAFLGYLWSIYVMESSQPAGRQKQNSTIRRNALVAHPRR